MGVCFGLSGCWNYGYTQASADEPVGEAVSAAKTALNLHSTFQAAQSLLIEDTVAIDGKVADEDDSRTGDADGLLGGRATSFSSASLQHFDGVSPYGGTTALTMFCWVRTSVASGDWCFSQYGSAAGNHGWLIGIASGRLRINISSDGNATNFKDWKVASGWDLNDDEWHLITITVNANDVKLYQDGKRIPDASITKSTDGTLAGVHGSTEDLLIGGYANGSTGTWDGEISLAGYYEGEWTAAQVRDFFLNEGDFDSLVTKVWQCDGAEAWDLVGTDHLTPRNTPTLYEDADIPMHFWDYNQAGHTSKLVNDDFSSDDGKWTLDTAKWSITGGTLTTSTHDANAYYVETDFVSGREYDYEIVVDEADGTDYIELRATGFLEATLNTTGTLTGRFTASGTDIRLRSVIVGGSVTISSVKIWAVDPTLRRHRPARIGTALDSLGADLEIIGPIKRQGQLTGGPCISLASASSQYGEVANTADYAPEDYVFSGYCYATTLPTSARIAHFQDNSGTGRAILYIASSGGGAWTTSLDGGAESFNSIDNAATGVNYYFELEVNATDSELTLTVTNLDTGKVQSQIKTGKTPDSDQDGDINIGSTKGGGGNYWDGKLWGLGINCTSTPTKSKAWPITETRDSTSYEATGNGGNITWINSPSWGTQDEYFYNRVKGFSVGNVARIAKTPVSGDVFTFEIKCPAGEDYVILLNSDNGSNWAVAVEDGSVSTAVLDDATSITIDDVAWAGTTRDDLHTDLFDGTQHKLEVTMGANYATWGYVEHGNYGAQKFDFDLENTFCRLTHINGSPVEIDDYGLADSILLPSLDDSSADAFGLPVMFAAGPYHYDDGVSIDFAPVANTQWIQHRWQDAEFNATSAKVVSTANLSGNDITVLGRYTIDLPAGNTRMFDTRDTGLIRSSFGAWFDNANTEFEGSAGGLISKFDYTLTDLTEYLISIGYEYSSGNVTVLVDESNVPLTSGSSDSEIGLADPFTLGTRADGSAWLDGKIRNISVTIDNTIDIDWPLAGNSLDLTANCNHGDDTDMVYNAASITDWTYGDTQVQPISVQSETGYEDKIISFTFGVPA